MKDRNLWMKKEKKRTAPGLKGALKAVLGHKIVRLAGIAGVSLLFSASAAQTVLADDAGVWQPVENGYYLVGMDGSYLTGWQQMGGKWYLLGADGLMKTGWEQENGTWYYLQGDGAMATGWQNIDGKYYFLKDSGAMEERPSQRMRRSIRSTRTAAWRTPKRRKTRAVARTRWHFWMEIPRRWRAA